MTVAELIAKLQELDQSSLVVVQGWETGADAVDTIEEVHLLRHRGVGDDDIEYGELDFANEDRDFHRTQLVAVLLAASRRGLHDRR